MKNIFIFISLIIIGFIQCAAMLNGLNDKLGKVFGFIVSLILGEIPIVGTILGIRGAVVNWNWAIWQAILLFIVVPIILIFLIGFFNEDKNN